MVKLEGEPKKGSQKKQISEIDQSSQVSQISPSSDKSGASAGSDEFKKSKEIKARSDEKSNGKSSKRRFRDFLAGGDISPKSSASVSSPSKEEPHKGKDIEKNKDSEAHDFHFSQELMKFNFYRKLRSNKEQVIQIGGGIIGAIFIIAGILYLLGSTIRVADNVIFGERAVISAFLILVGVLIIAGIFASRLLEGSFLKSIHSELEVAEDQDSKDNSKDKKEKQKDNIEEKDKK
jgi:uncharacterized membrane protein